jgi:PAP2 superfamily
MNGAAATARQRSKPRPSGRGAVTGLPMLAFFVNEHPLLGTLSTAVYMTTLAQVALVVVLLGTIGKLERARHFVSAVMAGALLCIFMSAVLPAAGAFGTLPPPADFSAASQPLVDLGYKQTFFDLRSGAERFISLDSLRGLIAFPSYHCMLSALIVMAFLGLGRWFWPVLALNFAVVLSTPVDGDHHLTDALAGVLVALVSWKLVQVTSLVRDRKSALQAAE